jgi:hypothetical protein
MSQRPLWTLQQMEKSLAPTWNGTWTPGLSTIAYTDYVTLAPHNNYTLVQGGTGKWEILKVVVAALRSR